VGVGVLTLEDKPVALLDVNKAGDLDVLERLRGGAELEPIYQRAGLYHCDLCGRLHVCNFTKKLSPIYCVVCDERWPCKGWAGLCCACGLNQAEAIIRGGRIAAD
jgi:hypothetical protein